MKNKNGFTIIELIMVMIIIGVLAAVAIPRFQDVVIESEIAVEQRVINTIYNGLETYARERYIENGVRSWPENPFTALSKLPPDYDADLYVLSLMKDRDWVFTGDGNNSAYNNTIAHLRKSDSISTWTYDQATGAIDYNGTPFGPLSVIHRVNETGGN
jgi:prepilin-type N-terminal cleavage/methylation domain-containing protein|tara:strand:- start:1418 stop:1891 length:474 start_codon:yes stop_codon:yes gene_type:complete